MSRMAILFRGKIFLEMSPTKRVGIAVGLPSGTMLLASTDYLSRKQYLTWFLILCLCSMPFALHDYLGAKFS
jgi:hypothetical protein